MLDQTCLVRSWNAACDGSGIRKVRWQESKAFEPAMATLYYKFFFIRQFKLCPTTFFIFFSFHTTKGVYFFYCNCHCFFFFYSKLIQKKFEKKKTCSHETKKSEFAIF